MNPWLFGLDRPSLHGRRAKVLTRLLVGFKRGWLLFELVFEVMWIGTIAPPTENVSTLRCTSGRTNIDCNDIGVPYCEVTRPAGAPARTPVRCR